jgi:hypothetical protein
MKSPPSHIGKVAGLHSSQTRGILFHAPPAPGIYPASLVPPGEHSNDMLLHMLRQSSYNGMSREQKPVGMLLNLIGTPSRHI